MRLGRAFFERDSLTVARELVGKRLCSAVDGRFCSGIIVETEAYLGEADAAAHSYKGATERVRALYGEKGCAYIYLIYGIHNCLNIATGPAGVPECVLIRAVMPEEGLDTMRSRRGRTAERELCSGPGKLTRAFGVTRGLYGEDMCLSDTLWIEDGQTLPSAAGARIGVDYAGEAARYPYRFTANDNPYISQPPR